VAARPIKELSVALPDIAIGEVDLSLRLKKDRRNTELSEITSRVKFFVGSCNWSFVSSKSLSNEIDKFFNLARREDAA